MSPIPASGSRGCLPPFVGRAEDASGRSPYRATLTEVAALFCTSPRRTHIFLGLIRYREALYGAGVSRGFQWLDGSFFESKEPNDIDLVTFFHPPVPATQIQQWAQANQDILRPRRVKAQYGCDAYTVPLDADVATIIGYVHYWFGLFSHRRVTFEWKGLVEVPLSPQDDATAQRGLIVRP